MLGEVTLLHRSEAEEVTVDSSDKGIIPSNLSLWNQNR
jgi:hypothetical protein